MSTKKTAAVSSLPNPHGPGRICPVCNYVTKSPLAANLHFAQFHPVPVCPTNPNIALKPLRPVHRSSPLAPAPNAKVTDVS
jgi:hypothetical protein